MRPKLLRYIAALALAAGVLHAQSTASLLARLDEAARRFTGVTARLRSVHHLPVIEPDEVETGAVVVKRTGPEKVRYLLRFIEPDPKAILFQNETVEVFYPKRNEIEVWNAAEYRDLTRALVLTGFGMPGRSVAANYEIRIAGTETIESQSVAHLELTPRSQRIRGQVNRIDLWISPETGCAAQQKVFLPGGEFRLNTFSDLKVSPQIPASELELPKGAKRIKMN